MLDQAGEATEFNGITKEREYLEQNIISVQYGESSKKNISAQKLGEELKEKNSENNDLWDIIETKTKTNEGWYFIERGTELKDFGKTQYSWLINYETGKIIRID